MISVVIPCYNAADTVEETYQSLCKAEAGENDVGLEIIMVDDCSKDDTRAVLQKISTSDSRIKLILKDNNEGVSAARNDAISAATGEFVFFLDADDKVTPGSLSILASQMTDDVDFVRAKHKLWNPDNGDLALNEGEERNFPEMFAVPPAAVPQIVAIYSPWNALLRRSLIEENGLQFSPSLRLGEDRHFNIRYLRKCRKITLLNDYTYLWRKPTSHSGQATQVLVKNPEDVFGSIRQFVEQLTDPWFAESKRHRVFLTTSMVVEMTNFMTSFSKLFDKKELSQRAKDDLAFAIENLKPYWFNNGLSNVKGRTDVYETLYSYVAQRLGKAPDEAFFKEFFKALGQIRRKLAEESEAKAKKKDDEVKISSGSARKVLLSVFLKSRSNRDADFLAKEEEVILTTASFDRTFYRRLYPDVAASGVDELKHYLEFGAAELRNPNSWFDTASYFADHPELFQAGINPLSHYVRNSSFSMRQ